MSFSKADRNNQAKFGKDFQAIRLGATAYAEAVSGALHDEYDTERSAVKTVAKLTGANERSVKNWFDGKNGPSGELLILLCGKSDQVLETVLILSGRRELVPSIELLKIRPC
ncbi:hypothetical protein [Phyllobacterium myrsinacearum]|uniref:Uncharacterized protein n=1 Tax=Phyllobacterium myrsinacearum TaxID=28101 RepID=A0A839ETQ1_9HYPH|nr:hypothetical protein [Phyllobacterium myrsinacearum]MBA8882162.1 hypothetical protein [Phyllobacterium myrsinacearum]